MDGEFYRLARIPLFEEVTLDQIAWERCDSRSRKPPALCASLSCDPRDYSLEGVPPAIEEDWPVLAGFAELMAPYYPLVKGLGVRHVFAGWPTFTPDGRFIVGESLRVPGFVCAVGCNAHGVSGSAGIGRHVVEAIVERKPSGYVSSLSPDRFTETAWNWQEARRRAQGVYETYYHIGH